MNSLAAWFANVIKGQPVYQYLAIFSGTLSTVSTGMHYGWPSPSLPKLLKDDSPIHMTNDQSSWIVVISLFGTFTGAYLGARLADKIGRKNVILLTSIPLFISWMMIAFAKSISVLIVARFLGGLPEGLLLCALPMYFGEISNPNIRGFAGSFISVTIALGMLLSNIVGSYLSIKTAALLSSAIPLMLVLTFWWMPESPYYLIMKGRTDEAQQNLKILKGLGDVKQELEKLRKVVQEQNANKSNCLVLFTVKNHRRALFVGVGIRIAQQFSGINAVTFYAQTIFKKAGNGISPTTAASIYFTIYMIGLAVSAVLVDKIGRKPLMIISLIGTGTSLIIVGSYFYLLNESDVDMTSFTWIPILGLIVYIIAYSIGMQPVPTVLTGELFSTNVKAFALFLCSTSYSVGTATASKFFQITKDEFGMHVPFFAFTLCCVSSLMFILFAVPETKGKTLEEIQEHFKGEPAHKITLEEFPERFRQIEDA